jgi:hypothetical protein
VLSAAAPVVGGAQIVGTGSGVTRERLLASMRALEPVEPDDIDYER